MKAPHIPTVALMVSLSTFALTAAEAACQRKDLAGDWTISTVDLSEFGVQVSRCEISVNRRGRFGGNCISRIPGDSGRSRLFGKLRARSDCSVRGFTSSGNERSKVEAQVSPGKDVLTGIASYPSSVSQFTAVRR
jgi:hypothetical protein